MWLLSISIVYFIWGVNDTRFKVVGNCMSGYLMTLQTSLSWLIYLRPLIISYMSAIFHFIGVIYQHVNSTNKMFTTDSQQFWFVAWILCRFAICSICAYFLLCHSLFCTLLVFKVCCCLCKSFFPPVFLSSTLKFAHFFDMLLLELLFICVVKMGYRLCLIDLLLFGVFCDGCINLF